MSFIESRETVLPPLPVNLTALAAGDASLSMLEAQTAAATGPVAGTTAGEAVDAAPVQQPPQKTQADTKAEVPVAAKAVADAPAVQRGATFPAHPATATVAQVGKPVASPHAPSAANSIGSTVFALVLVIGLIFALSWLAKRLPGFRGTAAAGASLRVVGSLALSPRERLVVVAVGDTQLVLGVGTGGTRTLHTLSEPLPTSAANGTSAFAQVLSQHFGRKA